MALTTSSLINSLFHVARRLAGSTSATQAHVARRLAGSTSATQAPTKSLLRTSPVQFHLQNSSISSKTFAPQSPSAVPLLASTGTPAASGLLSAAASWLRARDAPLLAIPRRTTLHWTDHRMKRDVWKRREVREQAPLRARLVALKRNRVLPKDLREAASAELHALPANGSIVRVHGRCMIASRPRGIVRRWRLGRNVWRLLADYNNLSGVQRAVW